MSFSSVNLHIENFEQGLLAHPEYSLISNLTETIFRLKTEQCFDIGIISSPVTQLEAITSFRNRIIVDLYHEDKVACETRINESICDRVCMTYVTWFLGALSSSLIYMGSKSSLWQLGILVHIATLGYLIRFTKRSFDKMDEDLFELKKRYQRVFLEPRMTSDSLECLVCLDEIKPKALAQGHMALGRIAHVMHKQCFLDYNRHFQETDKLSYKCPCCLKTVISSEITVKENQRASADGQ